jgi:hypothetical protein
MAVRSKRYDTVSSRHYHNDELGQGARTTVRGVDDSNLALMEAASTEATVMTRKMKKMGRRQVASDAMRSGDIGHPLGFLSINTILPLKSGYYYTLVFGLGTGRHPH